jgi:hypothetical protein
MISIILMFLAGICNAIMDVLDFHYDISIFKDWPNQQWLDPSLSWKNKWKNGDPNQGEKFFGSSTVFVFLTDFWHFAKFLMLLFISFAIVFYFPFIVWWADLLIVYCIFTITFEIFYSKILIR